jgi:tetratricopeptide (TPR) repeat protein
MAATAGSQWSSLEERLAAGLRDRSGAVTRQAGLVASGAANLWRAIWMGVAAALLLFGLAVVAVSLWRGLVGVPSSHDLETLRDYMLLLVEAVVLLAALGLLSVVVLWLFHTDPAVISPFANATSIGSLTAVSDLLVGHLDRIGGIQRTPIGDIPGERLRSNPVQPRPETIDSSLANVGSINLGQASISIGQLLIALKRMLPVRGRGTTISGSVQQYGTSMQLVATVQRGRLMDTVMVHGEAADGDAPIPTLIPELAYRIHFALAGGRMEAGTWELLRCFTEARAAYQRYLNGGKGDDREMAVRLTWQAYAMDCTYLRLFGLLYGLGTSFFGTGDYPTATDMFRSSLVIAPRTPQALVQLARCHYALGEDDEARRVLEQALARPRSHPTARYMLGLLYGTIGQHERAIQELSHVRRRPRALRSSAWVTMAGLHLQAGDEDGHRHALRHVARRDFEADAYSRACWLSVTQDRDGAIDALREAFCKHLTPLEYALRDPDLHFVRDRCGLEKLRDLACHPNAHGLADAVQPDPPGPRSAAVARPPLVPAVKSAPAR